MTETVARQPVLVSMRQRRGDTYLALIMRQFVRNRVAVVGMVIVVVFGLTALFAPWIVPYDVAAIDPINRLQGPTSTHWLGTDELGRDILSRLIVGARITLIITMGAVGLALVVGTILGLLAGFFRGAVDTAISRIIDILMAIPGFLLAIAIIASLGVGTTNVIVAVGIYSIPSFARIARGATLAVRERDYIMAGRAIGSTPGRLMWRHIIPNILPPLIVQTTLRLATAILTASSLSFLGLGPQPPTPEWGAMISTARNFFTRAPHVILFPGLAILFVTISFNLMGDGLRDALDPHLRR